MLTGPRLLDGSRASDIVEAARIVRDGGLAIVPTDTLYGLAASVFRAEAIERVFAVKERTPTSSLPILLGTAADLPILVERVPRVAWKLIDAFWPGPLTLVLPAKSWIPRNLTSRAGTVGVRVPAGRTCLQLLQVLGEPITGTSANVSGRPPPSTADEALLQLGDRVDALLAHDVTVRLGGPSTVVELTSDGVVVHRPGVVSADQIRQAVGLPVVAGEPG
jgi:L-threonylcarbamoyladenylate synthase